MSALIEGAPGIKEMIIKIAKGSSIHCPAIAKREIQAYSPEESIIHEPSRDADNVS